MLLVAVLFYLVVFIVVELVLGEGHTSQWCGTDPAKKVVWQADHFSHDCNTGDASIIVM